MDKALELQVLEALQTGALPSIEWLHEDDLCDCTFQRIGLWKNPYLAETLEVRMCCIWENLYRQYPDQVRKIPGYWNENTKTWITEPWAWDGEADMPKPLWYRQLARQQDRSVADIRAEYTDRDHERPRGKPKAEPVLFYLPLDSAHYLEVDLGTLVWEEAGAGESDVAGLGC